MKYFPLRMVVGWHWVMLALTGILCAGLQAAEVFTPRAALREGAGTIKRDEMKVKLAAGKPPVALRVGDTLSTEKKSAARISFSRENAIEVEEKTSLVLKKLEFFAKKHTVALGISLEAGKIQPAIYEPKKEEIKKGKAWIYDFQVTVGKGLVSGRSFVGEIVRKTKKRYTVKARAGRPIVQHGEVLVELGSAVMVDEGPPFVVTASEKNEAPVVAAYSGSVVFVLQPGQAVEIEWTEDGVWLTNLSADQPLYACGWQGTRAVKIAPREMRFFGLVELEIGRDRALAHLELLTELIRETMPEALPPVAAPPVAAPPGPGRPEIIEWRAPREGQGGLVSPAE